MRYMKAELKRSICNGQVFLAMLLCLGIYAFGEGYQGWVNIVLYPGTTWIHNHNGFMMEFNPFRSLLPLPAVFAAGNLLIEDWEHRGFFFQTTRCSFRQFCQVKFFVPCLMGGLVLALGLVCYLGFMACFVPAYDESTYYEPFIEPLLLQEQWGLYFLYFSSLQFLLGAMCAGMGCVTALLTPRRGMVYLMPMLLLAMLEIVTNITLVGLSGAQSSIVFRLEKQTPLHVYGVIAGILLGVTLIAYGVFCVLLKRRVYQWQ